MMKMLSNYKQALDMIVVKWMTGDHGSVRDLEPIDKDGSGTLHCLF